MNSYLKVLPTVFVILLYIYAHKKTQQYNKITFIGDSRLRTMYLIFIHSFQNKTAPNVNPRECVRKNRLLYGNDLICKHKEGTWEGCMSYNRAIEGCYYNEIKDKITYARDCSWRNYLSRKRLGCEERYKKINGIEVEYIYTTSIFWSDPYLDGIVERIQIKNDTSHLYVIQTNAFTYFNGDKYPNQNKNSCHQFFIEIQVLLKRLKGINVVFVSNSFYPGFFEETYNTNSKTETHFTNFFRLRSPTHIWKKMENIANRKSSTGVYNFKHCARAELLVRNSTFRWIDALTPTYWNYNTYDSKHFYPKVYNAPLTKLINLL